MPQTEIATVALARDGDSDAFRTLVERHSRAVFRLAHRMTGNASDAEDVVQETFLKAYKQLGRFESRANFGTWLHRIAVNCSIDLIRSRPHKEAGHDAADLEAMGGEEAGEESRQHTPERLMLSTEVQDRINDRDVHAQPAWSGRPSSSGTSRATRSRTSAGRSGSRRTPPSTASSARSARCARRSSRSWPRKKATDDTSHGQHETHGPRIAHGQRTDRVMTIHLTEDELVLHYYGELPTGDERARDDAPHVVRGVPRQPAAAAARAGGRRRAALAGPELPEHFERTVWAKLAPNLQRTRGGWASWFLLSPGRLARLAWMATVVLLVGAAFMAGRLLPRSQDARGERRAIFASASCSSTSAITSIVRRWCSSSS